MTHFIIQLVVVALLCGICSSAPPHVEHVPSKGEVFSYTVGYSTKKKTMQSTLDTIIIDNNNWKLVKIDKFTRMHADGQQILETVNRGTLNERLKTNFFEGKKIKLVHQGKTTEIPHSVSYHVIKGSPLTEYSWQDIKTKAGDIQYGAIGKPKFAKFQGQYEYNLFFNFLRGLDKDINYFVGLKVVNKVLKTHFGRNVEVPANSDDITQLIQSCDQQKTYYVRWHNGQLKGDENKNTKIKSAQAIVEHRDTTLSTFKYFAWITNPFTNIGTDFNGQLSVIQQVLGLRHDSGDKFYLLKADGTDLKSHNKLCFITLNSQNLGELKQNVEKNGYSSELLPVQGTVTVPGVGTANTATEVELLVRPVDEHKKIYYCGPKSGDKKEIVAYKTYSNINNMVREMWTEYASKTNNHEYVYNLFEFEMVEQTMMGCQGQLNEKKGLVIVNGKDPDLYRFYYKDYAQWWTLHARNLQRFFKPLDKKFYGNRAKIKGAAKIKSWLETQADKSVIVPTDLFEQDSDFAVPRKWYEYSYQMQKKRH
eukprot:297675_1